MKKLIKHISCFIKDSLNFIYILIQLLLQGAYKNKLENKFAGTVAVLANGPSLKEELPKLNSSEEFKNVDFIVLNFFAFEKTFFEIKPKHYCLADPMFFQDSLKKVNVEKLFTILQNEIDWDIYIYMPSVRYNQFIKYSKITNTHIKIVKMNANSYFGYEKFRHFFYKKNWAMPAPQTVANLAIFIGLNSGYEEVRLYGVDHTFLDSLSVNENNQLCNRELHFYDDQRSLKPLFNICTKEVYKVSDYLFAIGNMFRSHDLLNKYAIYLNVKIVNYTTCSMIDSYNRIKNDYAN